MGESITFEAEIEKAGLKVRWQKNNVDIAASDKYIIKADGNSHSLTINHASAEDEVVYAIIAGTSKVKFELKVKEPGRNETTHRLQLMTFVLYTLPLCYNQSYIYHRGKSSLYLIFITYYICYFYFLTI